MTVDAKRKNKMNEKQKNYLLIAAGVVIALLLGKILFHKPVYLSQPVASGGDEKGRKSGLSPYHDHQVKNTIMKNRGDVIKCYNAFVDEKPADPKQTKITDGPMKIDFEIDDDGDVIKAGKIGGIGDEKMSTCVIAVIKRWKFPEPNISAPVYVDHTFNFKKVTLGAMKK